MSLLVKICGLSTPDTLDAALDAGADMVGFVFFGPSPRNISLDTARELSARVNGRARKVALTVDVLEIFEADPMRMRHGLQDAAPVAPAPAECDAGGEVGPRRFGRQQALDALEQRLGAVD